MTRLGMSASANVALDMPPGYLPGVSAWNDLTPAEKRFIRAHLSESIDFWYASSDAAEVTTETFSGDDGKDGARGNAFLHAFWNALMVAQHGVSLAEEYANAHENRQDDQRHINMDLHNNRIGREVAASNPYTKNPNHLAELVMEALNQGRLRVICPTICR